MRTTIASDFHFGQVNHEAVEKWLEHVKETQPDKIIIAGDLLDALQLSHYNRVPEFGDKWDEEIAYARLFLEKLREISGAETIIIEGNHEIRLKMMVWNNAPALSGMSGFSIPERLGLKELNITWVPVQDGAAKFVDNFVEDQGFLIGHFNLARKGAGNTVRGLLQKYGKNIIQSHIHRIAEIHQRFYDKTLIGIECGCMCNINPIWMKYPDWQLGYVDLVDGKPELKAII